MLKFLKNLIKMSQKTINVSTDTTQPTSYSNNKLIYPAATRNREPILEVLKEYLKFPSEEQRCFLEISSGSGQHIAHFAPHFPNLTFQPSEVEQDLLHSIAVYAEECVTKNIKKPILIDICNNLSSYGFVEGSIDVIYNANMIHISPFECTIGLFTNAGKYLKPYGTMITYGPYAHHGVITPQSNVSFDQSLRSRDSKWGLRDIADLSQLAEEHQLSLQHIIDMPANNNVLIWKKVDE